MQSAPEKRGKWKSRNVTNLRKQEKQGSCVALKANEFIIVESFVGHNLGQLNSAMP